MKTVIKSNLIRLVELMKEYQRTKDSETLKIVNDYIDNVINKDKRYFSKLSSYEFDNETLKYLCGIY